MVWGIVNNEVYCYFFFLKKENKVGVVVVNCILNYDFCNIGNFKRKRFLDN